MRNIETLVDSLKLSVWIDVPVRILMSLLFLVSGFGKIAAVAGVQDYMEKHGVPGNLIWPTIFLEVGGGLLFLVGLWVRPLSILLALFCLVTAFFFHNALGDQNQEMNFLKNLVMAGAFLLTAKAGVPGFSIDAWLASKRAQGVAGLGLR